jgi:hypothetical protein
MDLTFHLGGYVKPIFGLNGVVRKAVFRSAACGGPKLAIGPPFLVRGQDRIGNDAQAKRGTSRQIAPGAAPPPPGYG